GGWRDATRCRWLFTAQRKVAGAGAALRRKVIRAPPELILGLSADVHLSPALRAGGALLRPQDGMSDDGFQPVEATADAAYNRGPCRYLSAGEAVENDDADGVGAEGAGATGAGVNRRPDPDVDLTGGGIEERDLLPVRSGAPEIPSQALFE